MGEIFLPVFHSFENGNVFTGSAGLFRYKITPQIVMKTQKEVDFEASSMKAEVWHGLFCYDKSEIEGECVFPLSRGGYDELRAWIDEQFAKDSE